MCLKKQITVNTCTWGSSDSVKQNSSSVDAKKMKMPCKLNCPAATWSMLNEMEPSLIYMSWKSVFVWQLAGPWY